MAYYDLHPAALVVYRGTANFYPLTLVIVKAALVGFAYLTFFLIVGTWR